MEMQPGRSVGAACSTAAAIVMALSLLAGAVPPALAAPTDLTGLSIEELLTVEVSTASKFLQKTTEAPAAVTVISAADIRSFGYRTLADILRSVRGLFVTYDRNYQYAGVRGFNRPGDYNSRILLLVDGYRVNDAMYDTASIGQEFFLDVDLIERVEVVRGPGSSLYGSSAFFGVVNVITRSAAEVGGLELSGEAASFGTGKARATLGRQCGNGASALLSASYFDSQGQDLFFREFDAPATSNGVAHGLDYESARRVFGKLALGGWTLTGAYSERVKGVPTASYGSAFDDPRTQTEDSQAALDVGYYRALSRRVSLSSHVSYGGYFYDATFPYDRPPVTVNHDRTSGEWWGVEAKLVSLFDAHTLVTGAEYRDNYRLKIMNRDAGFTPAFLDTRHSSRREALYLQDEWALSKVLLLNAGLRFDRYSTAGEAFNPRVALIYAPWDSTTLKLLYGTAFRSPNAYELFYNSAALGSKANLALKPEEIATYELVAEQAIGHNFRLTASAYWNDIHNLINYVVDPADDLLVFQNLGRVKGRGVELEAERAWTGGTRLRVSYSRQSTRNDDTGKELENSPRDLAKVNYSVPLFAGALRAGAELQYTGGRKTLGGGTAGGYWLTNVTLLTGRIARNLELSASVYNLFDRRYVDPGRPEHLQDTIPQDDRSYRFTLSFRY